MSAYAAKSKKPAAEILEMLSNETWLSAAEAKAAGFVDVITGANPAQACAWSSKYPRLATAQLSKGGTTVPKTLAEALAAISDPRAKDLFFRKNRIAIIRETARSATPEMPTPRTLSEQIAAISEPHQRSTFYKANRTLLLRQESQAATPGCIHLTYE